MSDQITKKIKIYATIYFVLLFILKITTYQFFNEGANFLVETSGHPYYLEYIYNLNIDFIFYKIKIIIPYLIYYTLNNIFFILGILILLILSFAKDKNTYNKSMLFYLILNSCFIFFAYIFRDMEIKYSVQTTMERIIFTSSGFYVFLVLNFIKNLERELSK